MKTNQYNALYRNRFIGGDSYVLNNNIIKCASPLRKSKGTFCLKAILQGNISIGQITTFGMWRLPVRVRVTLLFKGNIAQLVRAAPLYGVG